LKAEPVVEPPARGGSRQPSVPALASAGGELPGGGLQRPEGLGASHHL
jgi:hypothetical protein